MFVCLHDHGGAVAGNAAIGELQVVAGFGSAADQEGALRHADKAAGTVWRNHLQASFRHNGYNIPHKTYLFADCSTPNSVQKRLTAITKALSTRLHCAQRPGEYSFSPLDVGSFHPEMAPQ